MPWLTNIEQVRSEEWSKSYLWDLNFPAFPLGWFPAVDVEEPLANVVGHEIAQGMGTYGMPKGTAAMDLKVTFIEFADHRVSKWLQAWMNDVILNNGSHIATLAEAGRQVVIQKLNHDKTVQSTTTYIVYPEGPLVFHGSSESSAELISQDFKIIGR